FFEVGGATRWRRAFGAEREESGRFVPPLSAVGDGAGFDLGCVVDGAVSAGSVVAAHRLHIVVAGSVGEGFCSFAFDEAVGGGGDGVGGVEHVFFAVAVTIGAVGAGEAAAGSAYSDLHGAD